ncbi:MAG: EamA family transporter, partial [Thermomicrobiaceae bacterium]|nr:EamA family transporter [Thermomicrobiaceae bacterium]
FRWSNVPVATVLLYTAPAWVTAGEVLFLGYPLTRKAATAVGLALLGSVLVSGVVGGASGPVSALGVAAGVLSAVAYGSYSVLGKHALHRVPALVVAAYGTAIGAALLLPAKLALSGPAVPSARAVAAIALWPGIGITVLPVALYTVGLRALRPSTASVLATLEPVVAIVLAALVLGQRLGVVQTLGAALILASVLYTLAGSTAGRGRDEPAA